MQRTPAIIWMEERWTALASLSNLPGGAQGVSQGPCLLPWSDLDLLSAPAAASIAGKRGTGRGIATRGIGVESATGVERGGTWSVAALTALG